MSSSPLPGADAASLLHTNDAFYAALASGDIEAMDELWARGVAVACMHPGWPPLHGREEVMWSWRSILLGGSPPAIRCEAARPVVRGDTGWVTCLEVIGSDTFGATNLFVRQNGVWQIAHHHAGPVRASLDASGDGSRLN